MRVVRPVLETLPVFHSTTVPLCNTATKKIQNYLIYMNECLGSGNFSQVFRGINTLTNEQVAIKVIDLSSLKSQPLRTLLHNEIAVLKVVRHPNILRCYDILTSNNNCYIVTELCNEGDIETKGVRGWKGALDEQKCKAIICDVYQGLLYLAEKGIVHRDVKVANVFVKDGTAKIADFGFAKQTSERFKDINVGSPIYMSPQGLIDSMYGPKTDVWAFGTLMYQLLHGDPPLSFCSYENELKIHIVKPVTAYATFKHNIPLDLKDLILKCLQVDERRRISMRDIQFHPYMQRIMRELGRTPSLANRNNPFSSVTSSNYKPQLNRSVSAEHLDARNHLARTVSEDKLRGNPSDYSTPQKSNPNLSLTLQHQSLPQQLSPSVYLNLSSLHKLQPGTNSGSTATTATNHSSENYLPLTFDESLYLLHYCRLLYKTVGLMNKASRVAMLNFNGCPLSDCYSNWLLDSLEDLEQRTPAVEASERQCKLKAVLHEYLRRYSSELRRNPSINVREVSIRSATKHLLEYIDKLILEDPGADQQELATLGSMLMAIVEVTDIVEQCKERGEYSMVISCKPTLDVSLSGQAITVSGYLAARGKAARYCS